MKLDDKKIFLEESIKEIQLKDDFKISSCFNVLNWIDSETSQSLREQMYFSSNKELQVKLYFENSVIYIPELNNDEVDEYFHKTSKLLINKPIDFTIDFISKWESISPELIKYQNLANYLSDLQLLQIWVKGKIPITFFGNKLTHIISILFFKPQDGPLISFAIILKSSPISSKSCCQLSGRSLSLLINFKYICSINALFDLLRNDVFSNSRFFDVDIYFIDIISDK